RSLDLVPQGIPAGGIERGEFERALPRQLFHRAEAPFEFCVCEAQRFLGIDLEMSRPIRNREQQVADLLRATRVRIHRARHRHRVGLGQLFFYLCTHAARASEGSASGTSASSLGEASVRPARSRALCSSQARFCSATEAILASANTCGWRAVNLSEI